METLTSKEAITAFIELRLAKRCNWDVTEHIGPLSAKARADHPVMAKMIQLANKCATQRGVPDIAKALLQKSQIFSKDMNVSKARDSYIFNITTIFFAKRGPLSNPKYSWHRVVMAIELTSRLAEQALVCGNVGRVRQLMAWCLHVFTLWRVSDWIKCNGGWEQVGSQLSTKCQTRVGDKPALPFGEGSNAELNEIAQQLLRCQESAESHAAETPAMNLRPAPHSPVAMTFSQTKPKPLYIPSSIVRSRPIPARRIQGHPPTPQGAEKKDLPFQPARPETAQDRPAIKETRSQSPSRPSAPPNIKDKCSKSIELENLQALKRYHDICYEKKVQAIQRQPYEPAITNDGRIAGYESEASHFQESDMTNLDEDMPHHQREFYTAPNFSDFEVEAPVNDAGDSNSWGAYKKSYGIPKYAALAHNKSGPIGYQEQTTVVDDSIQPDGLNCFGRNGPRNNLAGNGYNSKGTGNPSSNVAYSSGSPIYDTGTPAYDSAMPIYSSGAPTYSSCSPAHNPDSPSADQPDQMYNQYEEAAYNPHEQDFGINELNLDRYQQDVDSGEATYGKRGFVYDPSALAAEPENEHDSEEEAEEHWRDDDDDDIAPSDYQGPTVSQPPSLTRSQLSRPMNIISHQMMIPVRQGNIY